MDTQTGEMKLFKIGSRGERRERVINHVGNMESEPSLSDIEALMRDPVTFEDFDRKYGK